MPLQDYMQLVSTDDHLIERPNLWESRLPRTYVERGPRNMEVEQGRGASASGAGKPAQVWFYNGREYPQIGLNARAGQPREEWGTDPMRFDEMLPGCYDPEQRVRDMDLDGVTAAVCFPQFPRFAGGAFIEGVVTHGDPPELGRLCVQAWNDHVLEEWYGPHPSRFVPLGLLPLWDIDAAITEAQRAAGLGTRTFSFPENPVTLGLPSFHTDHWDRLFDVIEDLDTPLGLHFGSGSSAPQTSPEAPLAVMTTLMGCNSMYAAADLLFSPVFHRHPRLKVAFSEGGVGWMPYLLERADFVWERHRWYQDINRDIPPSELFRRHVWGCFIEDEHGMKSRYEIGIDRITWECDYPHTDSHWPQSRKRAAEQLADVPDDEAHMIVELNARQLFNFPRSA